MRASLKGPNGCICNRCGKKMLPVEATKIYAKILSRDREKAATGHYDARSRFDLCESCYNELMAPIAETPRK